MKRLPSILILSALVVAGCSERNQHTVTDPATGAQVDIQTGENMRPPANLPAFAPIYPDARIENVMESSNAGSDGADEGGMVVFHTSHDIERVAEFYRGRFERAGLSEIEEVRISGAVVLAGSAPDDPDNGAQVSISPATEGSGSTVTLIYSAAG